MKTNNLGISGLILAALFTTSSANANTWDLNFTGIDYGNLVFTTTTQGPNLELVSAVTGSIDGSSVNQISSYAGANNLLYTTGPYFADFSGISVTAANTTSYNLANWPSNIMSVNNSVSDPGGTGSAFQPITSFTLVAAPVPEPTEGALLLSGLGLMGFISSRRKKTA